MNDKAPKVSLINEEELEKFNGKLPNVPLVYFRIVSIGKRSICENDHDPKRVLKIAKEAPGFVLIGEDSDDVCDAMHQIVMKFRNALVGSNDESKN